MTKVYKNGSNKKGTLVSFTRKQQLNYQFSIKMVLLKTLLIIYLKNLKQNRS